MNATTKSRCPFKRQVRYRMKIVIPICFFCICFMLQGCITPSIEAQRKSFEPYKTLSINDEPIESFLNSRTALLATSDDYEFTISSKDDKTILKFKTGGFLHAGGMAVAVSRDGYFLIAEHAIRRHANMLFYWTSDGFYMENARVVKRFSEIDLAILKVGFVTRKHFELEPCEFAIGTRLFAGGTSVNSFSSGELLSVKEKTLNGFTYFELETSLPLRRGDSGGPLVDAAGNLLGIIFEATAGVFSEPQAPKGYAVMLDFRHLQSVIEKDRKSIGDDI